MIIIISYDNIILFVYCWIDLVSLFDGMSMIVHYLISDDNNNVIS